jgi:alkyl hydroperoxide reductase subunit AhpC
MLEKGAAGRGMTVYNPFNWKKKSGLGGFMSFNNPFSMPYAQEWAGNSSTYPGQANWSNDLDPFQWEIPDEPEAEKSKEAEGEADEFVGPPDIDEPAPDFKLPGYYDGRFTEFHLSQHRGKWVVLFFYGGDFTSVCPTELRALARDHEEMLSLGAHVFGISTDSIHVHKAFHKQTVPEVNFPLLSDGTRDVCVAYGALDHETGSARRATVIVDPDGLVKYFAVYHNHVGRSMEEIKRVLQALIFVQENGSLAGCDWKPGDPGIEFE